MEPEVIAGEETPVESVQLEPDAESDAALSPEEPESPPEPPKKREPKGVQRRIDKLVAEREYYRGLAEGRESKEPAPQSLVEGLPPEPREENFTDYGEYQRALIRWETKAEIAAEKLRQGQAAQVQAQDDIVRNYQDWVADGEERFEDFADMAERVGTKLTPQLGMIVRESEFGHALVNYLDEYPKEIVRLSKLSLIAATREVVKLEGRLSQPPQKNKTHSPKPTRPVGGREVPAVKLEDMPYDQYKAYMDKREFGER